MSRVPKSMVFAATFASLFFASNAVQADLVINLWEDGVDVRGRASGSLDITGLSFLFSNDYPSDFRIQPNEPEILFLGRGDVYSGIVSFPSFGSGLFSASGTSTGDHFGFEGNNLLVSHILLQD